MRLFELKGQLEQRTLGVSVWATLGIATIGILFGMLSQSFAILFDGVYSLIDASMSLLSLWVARLILTDITRRGGSGAPSRYHFGYWHFEPMVLALNSTLLTLAGVYALFNAVMSILAGGRDLAFGWAILYAAVVVVICFGMAVFERRRNERVKSEFLALDAKGWIMSGSITLALLIGFGSGFLIEGTRFEGWRPYIDPIVLILVCVVIIPMPLGTLARAMREIFLLAPEELTARVRAAAEAAVARHGFIDSAVYVARVGRSAMIEVHLVAAPDFEVSKLAELDAIRDEIGAAIGDEGPNRWLTVSFTTDRDWAT